MVTSDGRALIEQMRALARRRGDSRWRLLGIELRHREDAALAPALDAWAEGEGLGGWSQHELQVMYIERFGAADRDGVVRTVRSVCERSA